MTKRLIGSCGYGLLVGALVEFRSSDPACKGWKRGVVDKVLQKSTLHPPSVRIKVGEGVWIIRHCKNVRRIYSGTNGERPIYKGRTTPLPSLR